MIRIGFYINYDSSFTGGPRVACNFAEALDRAEFSPVFMTNRISPLTEQLQARGDSFHIVPQPEVIGDRDGDVFGLGLLPKFKALLAVLRYNREVARLVKQERLDCLWVRNIKGVLLTALAAKRSRVPLIWDIGMEKKSQGLMYLLHLWGIALADKVVVEADCVPDGIFTRGQRWLLRNKLVCIRSGIPRDRALALERRAAPAWREGEPFRILSVASLNDRKNQLLLLKAVLQLRQEFPFLRVRLVGPLGDEAYVQRIQAFIREHGLETTVELLGWREDVVDLMHGSHLFAITSRTEGVPYAVMEAMHAGLPIVSTAVGGVPDVIDDGINGWTVADDDAAALTAALKRIVRAPNERKAVVARAYECVAKRYNVKQWMASYQAFIKGLVEAS